MELHRTIVDVDQARRILDRGGAVFDCSFDLADPDAGRRGFAQEHLPGARYLHLDDDLSGKISGLNGRHPLPDPTVLEALLRRLGLNDGQQVVAYDSSGGPYAARLWWLLRWLGHPAVAVLDGGIAAWKAAKLPLETGEATPVAEGDFRARAVAQDAIVDAAAVESNIAAGKFLVVDARSAARFHGAPNPLDPVPGHIPGARNRFFGDNLDTLGRFKSAEQLAEEFEAVLAGVDASDAVMQCGSGVTACHNLLALEVAGKTGARLYPGSWSEWIADPRRPIDVD